MYILGLDTSTAMGSVGLIYNDRLIGEYILNVERTRSEKVMATVAMVLEDAKVSSNQLEAIAVTLGPGSFTGLRIGVVTAKSLSYALGIPLIGVSTLEALAENFCYSEGLICPILDARRGQVYAGIYKYTEPGERAHRYMEDKALKIHEFLDKIEEYIGDIIFCGEGALKFKEDIRGRLGSRAIIPSGSSMVVRGALVAQMGYRSILKGEATCNAFDLKPYYLRRSDAEINFKK